MAGSERLRAHLTKTGYLDFLRCPKRLWLKTYANEFRTPNGPAAQARLETGEEVGTAARSLFPRGVLVEGHDWGEALTQTADAMRNPRVQAVFEAAFEHRGIRIRVDVLERLDGNSWGLREVKTSTGIKHEHLNDIAIQYFVLRECRIRVPSVELIHVDGSYKCGPGEASWERLFSRRDLTDEIHRAMPEVPNRTAEAIRLLQAQSEPQVRPAHQCTNPYDCEFKAHCTRDKPLDWIRYLPGLTRKEYQELSVLRYERIKDIPEKYRRSEARALQRRAIDEGRPVCTDQLGEALSGFGPPAVYLDIETMSPAIPLYEGTHPYDVIPFQWSLHEVDSSGSISHRGFLAEGRSDPRREFCETLIEVLRGREEPVVVYSSYEKRQLFALGRDLADLEPELDRIRGKILDLYEVVRSHVYHPEFRGSFSLKTVGPVLVPGLSYDDLAEIGGGQDAAGAFLRIAQRRTTGNEEALLRAALLDYCARDTRALFLLHRALRALSARYLDAR
jgi:predicted RecB family nuclease